MRPPARRTGRPSSPAATFRRRPRAIGQDRPLEREIAFDVRLEDAVADKAIDAGLIFGEQEKLGPIDDLGVTDRF